MGYAQKPIIHSGGEPTPLHPDGKRNNDHDGKDSSGKRPEEDDGYLMVQVDSDDPV